MQAVIFVFIGLVASFSGVIYGIATEELLEGFGLVMFGAVWNFIGYIQHSSRC